LLTKIHDKTYILFFLFNANQFTTSIEILCKELQLLMRNSPHSSSLKRSPLQELTEILASEMLQVDKAILEATKSDVSLIPKITHHLIQSGGKRLRPLLTLACNSLFGAINANAVYLSAAIEFIHSATLLHDDVVDDSILRRNQPAANKIWGNSASILVGDFLFARAFELMVRCQNLAVLEILSAAAAKIAEGEVLQLQYCQDFGITQEVALKIMGAKTAELFAAACQVGGTLANVPLEQQRALHAYGFSLGLIFQITDDILDYTSAERGKAIGEDFREGKITLPVIFTYQNCSHKERSFLREVIQSETLTDKDLDETVQIIEKSGGFEQSYQLAHGFNKQAVHALDTLPQSSMKVLLEEIAAECLGRKR
jgi:octaprenyl-diphosphate synthase